MPVCVGLTSAHRREGVTVLLHQGLFVHIPLNSSWMSSAERRPLLTTNVTNSQLESNVLPIGLGPMELSKSSRVAILIGVWSSTFLSVRDFYQFL